MLACDALPGAREGNYEDSTDGSSKVCALRWTDPAVSGEALAFALEEKRAAPASTVSGRKPGTGGGAWKTLDEAVELV